MIQNTLAPYTTSISSRYSGSEAIRSQLDGDTSTSTQFTSPYILPTRSRGFEIQGVSTRQLSSEAIQALSPGGDHVSFGSSSTHAGDDVMVTPFLGGDVQEKDCSEDSTAGLESVEAISTLESQPTSTPDGIEDVEKDLGEMDQEGEEKLDVNDTAAAATNEDVSEVSEVQSKEDAVYDVDQEKQRLSRELNIELQHENTSRRYKKVIKVFKDAQSNPDELLDDQQLISIFHHLLHHDVLASYDVLKYYAARCKERGTLVRLDMYQRVIHRIRPVDMHSDLSKPKSTARRMNPFELRHFVEDLALHLQEEYSEGKKMVYQHILLPEIVLALSEHKNASINLLGKPIIDYVLDKKFPVLNPELYEYMLSRGRRSETGPEEFFPYRRVLAELIRAGHTPKSEAVMTVLQCYHPFNDIKATYSILSMIHKLHLGGKDSPSAAEDYSVDLGTLEAISMSSARRSVELSLLVWDLVELFGHTPTEGMFEDVIMSFASTKQDDNMYAALVDMEKNGFVPSPSLMRYVAVKVSFNERRMEHSHKMLTWKQNEHMRSTHAMNVMLIGYGMKRDINSAFYIFEELPRFNLQPDANTFSFLMEALYIDTKERFPPHGGKPPPQDIDDVLGASQIILDAMGEAEIEKTKQFYYEHIRLLCALSLLDDANLVLEDAIMSGVPIPRATLFILANRFADNGNYELAHKVAGLSAAAGCGKFPRLISRINNIERAASTAAINNTERADTEPINNTETVESESINTETADIEP
eukprot:CAMPEP_0172313854 /NCGR_PEP_ID=MMETSP1058-20130122/21123_1 /TAXON_ID=83371 /ORGANISM="Detonula confervacea, Strain CCMP 353" /LENGTH=756 /DNA_ID=CAMNT_0013027577 /DNA_START=99 /DNA_END=2369 /DNA_ORIENTATION=-